MPAPRIASVLLMLLVACTPPPNPGGTGTATDGGPGTDGGSTTLATWASDYVDAYCAFAVRCGYFADLPFCEAVSGPEFTVATFLTPASDVAAALADKSQFNGSEASACLAALSSISCTVATPLAGALTACGGVFTGGTVANGGACISNYECMGTSSCVAVASNGVPACAGTCQPPSASNCSTDADCPAGEFCGGGNFCAVIMAPGAVNAPCGGPTACQTGLACDDSQSPPTCVTPGAAGATCFAQNLPSLTGTCATGLACVVSDDGTTATCMTPASLGQSCTSLFQCGAQYVISDIICDETSGKCAPMPSTGPCAAVSTQQNTCNLTVAYCDASSGTATCQPVVPAGMTCDATTGLNPCAMATACETTSAGTTTVCTPAIGPVCTP